MSCTNGHLVGGACGCGWSWHASRYEVALRKLLASDPENADIQEALRPVGHLSPEEGVREREAASFRAFRGMVWEGDTPLPEDDAIDRAFPTETERHDLYDEAMRLVGARVSKGGIVDLVNWLLHRLDDAKTFETTAAKEIESLSKGARYHRDRWEDYERNYVLPAFRWAKEAQIDLEAEVRTQQGKNCVEILVRMLLDRLPLKEPVVPDASSPGGTAT